MSFRVGNCRVSFSYFFFVCVAVLLLFDRSGLAAAGLLAAAIHETAHLGTMHALGCMPEKIRFGPFGIDIVRSSRPDHEYWKDAAVSLAGPFANLAAAGFFFLSRSSAAGIFALANLALFLFNFLPMEPLDGGQALYALLCTRWSPDAAARVARIVSFLCLTPLAAVGFLALFRSPGNYSLLLVCVYLMALLVLKKGKYF